MSPLRQHRRVLAAAMIGTAIEFYDFFIYATAAALVFGPLFFPAESPAAQTLLAFLSFGIAFIARPVGAALFGHFGDRIGRKSTLVGSLLLMGGSTLIIAFLPTYAMAGWIAPALLCLMRFGQGLGLGGEWGGAALLVVENAPKGWESRFTSIMQLGAPLGLIAANLVFLLLGLVLDDAQFMSWGWRLPFLASAFLVILGLWIRLRLEETPAFRDALMRAPPPRIPLVELFTNHWRALIVGAAAVVLTFTLFYLSTAFALAYMTGTLGHDREATLAVQTLSALVFIAAILVSGWLADRSSPARILSFSALAAIVVGLGFGPGLDAGFGAAALTLCVAMAVLGSGNGLLGQMLSQLFPVHVRYSGMSMAFNLGGIVGGACTPLIAQMLGANGLSAWIGGLIVAAGLITLTSSRLAKPLPVQLAQ